MDLSILNLPPAKLTQLNNANLFTIEDIANYFPRKYFDFSKTEKIKDVRDGMICRVVGEIVKVEKRKNPTMLKVKIDDKSGKQLEAIWFGTDYPSRFLEQGRQVVFAGTIKTSFWGIQMSSPYFSLNLKDYNGMLPVYKKVKGMSDEYLIKTVSKALDVAYKSEYLDMDTLAQFNLLKGYMAHRIIHQPPSIDMLLKAQNRVAFDDLFKFAYIMNTESEKHLSSTPVEIKTADKIKPFLESLPFELTDGDNSQLSTVREIFKTMKKGIVTSSLVQGDVSCGKTMVAILLSIIMAENGYKTIFMAPTTILAHQHYEEFCERFKDYSFIKPALLTASMKKKERTKVLQDIEDGLCNVLIGTHSVLSDKVHIKDLGLVVVDEEHRFGVEQRNKLIKNYDYPVHSVTMSATPIPRSLALTIYGDNFNVYTIKAMPKGRVPIKTSIVNAPNEAYDKIVEEVKKGHQAYLICPLIDESNSERMEGVISVAERFEELSKYAPSLKIGMITGKMKQTEVDLEIDKFKNKVYDVIVSTTIIEVGVNIPNSTLIVISNAERFGLATLHQLRGRVGRSSFESFCVLLADKGDNDRLNAMVNTTDGFIIAKKDLELRGMGDFIGTAQSGDNKTISLMLMNENLYMLIRSHIKEIFEDKVMKNYYDKYFEIV